MSVRFQADTDKYVATTGLPGSTLTFTCWAQISVDRNGYSTIFNCNSTGNEVWLSTQPDGTTLTLFGGTDAGFDLAAPTSLTVGTWYRIGVVLAGTSATLYVGAAGGGLTVTSTTSWPQLGTIAAFAIGGTYSATTETWNGRVANVKMYSAALTEAEVEAELAQFDPVRTADLLRRHPLHIPETADYSGNGYSLTAGSTSPTIEADPPITGAATRAAVDLASSATGTVVSTAAAATTIAPDYPSLTVSAGQLACYYAYLHVRGAGRTVTTPAGWTLVGSYASTNTSAEGAGVGPTRTHVYRRTSTTALSGTQSFTISAQATSGVAQGYIRGYTAAGTDVAYEELLLGWSNPTTGTGGGSTAPDGALTVTAGQVAARDELHVHLGIADDDNTATSVGSITCTGATIGATSATATRTVTANGNDLATAGYAATVTAGTNTGTTLTVPVTQAPANQMHGVVLRVRATAAVVSRTGAATGTWVATGAAAGIAPAVGVREYLATGTVATSVSVTTGTGTQAGDVLVAFVSIDNGTSTDLVAPTGTAGTWTQATSLGYGSANIGVACWSRPVTVGGAQTVTASGPASSGLGLRCYVLIGAATSTPVDVAASGFSTSAVTPHVVPTVTATGDDDLLLGIVVADCRSGGNITYTPPTGMVADAAQNVSTFSTVASARQALTAAGATGTRTFTASAARPYLSLAVAVRAAPQSPTGSAAGGWSFTAAAAGKRPASGSAAGTLAYSATATGAVSRRGAGTGGWSSTGTASGRKSPVGAASGAWSVTGSGSGAAARRGAAVGAWTTAGAATAATTHRGAGGGGWSVTGTAVGDAPPNRGSATGAWSYTGSAAGDALPNRGAATGGWSFAGAATGDAPPNRGAAAGTHIWVGSATGAAARGGSATGGWTITGSGSGSATHAGIAAGAATFTGTATGKRPAAGTGAGTWTSAGAAAGTATRSGTAAGTATWTGLATSGNTRAGLATGATTWTGASTGRTSRAGTAAGSWTTTGAATGSAARQGAAAGTWVATGAATGAAPQVDARTGSAAGTWVVAGSSTGRTSRDGAATGTWAASGSAAGLAARRGNATGTWMAVGAATGTAPQVATRAGAAAGAWTFTTAAAGRRSPVGAAADTLTWAGVAVSVAAAKAGAAAGAWLYVGAAVAAAPAPSTRVTAGLPRLTDTIRAGDPREADPGARAGDPRPTLPGVHAGSPALT